MLVVRFSLLGHQTEQFCWKFSNFFDSPNGWHYIIPIISLVPSWISSFDSSGSKGFPSWLNSFVSEDKTHASQIFLERTWNLHDDEIQNVHSLSTWLNPQTVKQFWLLPGYKFAIHEIYPHLLLSQGYLHFLEKKDIFQSISIKGTYLNYIDFWEH